jgi:hypothetical protein
VKVLAGNWTAPQRSELVVLINPITQHHPEPRLRTDAIDALVSLRANSPATSR